MLVPVAEPSAGKGDGRGGRSGSGADQNGAGENERGRPQNGHPSGAQQDLSDEEVLPSF